MKNSINKGVLWSIRAARQRGLAFIAGLGFAVSAFLIINISIEPVSTDEYCGTACHEMGTAYRTWELSVHGANADGITVNCIDCHLPPREDFFPHLVAKAKAGARDMYMHHFGPPYEVDSLRRKVLEEMENETCMHCHDSLLARPASAGSRLAHQAAINQPHVKENRCVECHPDAAHHRNTTLFTPETE